jgi:hypothetical protein
MPASEGEDCRWRKSSHSSNVANCLEIAFSGTVVRLRDSKCTGPVLVLPAGSFATLVQVATAAAISVTAARS